MRIHRVLRPEAIRLSMATSWLEAPDDDWPQNRIDRYYKEHVIDEMVELLDATGAIASARKLKKDLWNREKQMCSGLGNGIALPHVRTLQAREFVMGFARSEEGIPFGAHDGEPVRFFLPMVAPPYEDRSYIRFLKHVATAMENEDCRAGLAEAETPHDVIRLFQVYSDGG